EIDHELRVAQGEAAIAADMPRVRTRRGVAGVEGSHHRAVADGPRIASAAAAAGLATNGPAGTSAAVLIVVSGIYREARLSHDCAAADADGNVRRPVRLPRTMAANSRVRMRGILQWAHDARACF